MNAAYNPARSISWPMMFAPVILGLFGFLLNSVPLSLGWGLHFAFGNALAFIFLRVLKPWAIIAIAMISGAYTVFLWGHGYAWAIWTLEAAFVAYTARRLSPIMAAVAFWLLFGIPMIWLSYGIIMEMAPISWSLVAAKQFANGVFNVVLGQIGYAILLWLKPRALFKKWPKLPFDSFLSTLFFSIVLFPAIAYLFIQAPRSEREAQGLVDDRLLEHVDAVRTNVDLWQRSVSASLRHQAQQATETPSAKPASLPPDLDGTFSEVAVFSRNGTLLSVAGNKGAAFVTAARDLLPARRPGDRDVALVAINGEKGSSVTRFILLVPFRNDQSSGTVAALLRPEALSQVLFHLRHYHDTQAFLLSPDLRMFAIKETSTSFIHYLEGLTPQQVASAQAKLVSFLGPERSSNAMSAVDNLRLMRATSILSGWQFAVVKAYRSEVLRHRLTQLETMLALCLFIVAIAAYASWFGKKTGLALRGLAKDAADLALMGAQPKQIDDLVIEELNDIAGSLVSTRSAFQHEHSALIVYQRRLRSIAKHAPVVVYALNIRDRKKGELVYVSDTIVSMLGYTFAEVSEPGWWSHAIHPEDYELCNAIFSDLYPTKIVNHEYRLRHKHGHYVWVYDKLAVERGSEPGSVEATGVLMDISERKAALGKLIQADKMASLGRLVAGTAHELNQPLHFIKIAASNLREGARRGKLDTEALLSRLDSIIANVGRASAIILQMRVFGRVPKDASGVVDVKTVVEAVSQLVCPQLGFDDTQLDTSECMEGLHVRAMPVLLEQVLLNLILNAHYSIRLRQKAGDARKGAIKVSVCREGWNLLLTVADNGTGLSESVMKSLFEPFFTTKPPKEGTGLGLSISYGIIRDLGGSLEADNTPDGARFTIRLPLAENPPLEAAGKHTEMS